MSQTLFADSIALVKQLVEEMGKRMLELLAKLDVRGSLREDEQAVVQLVFEWGREILSLLWSQRCQQATTDDIETRELDTDQVTLRGGSDYTWKVMSTLGPVDVSTFAYRDRSVLVGSVTRVPARKVFPNHRACRSSELCLEWECRLGAEHPFRGAQKALSFFTHDNVSLEDTTISRHLTRIGQTIDPRWFYRRPADIQAILRDRATRHRETGRPLIYLSSDAHVVRRYVDASWTPAWKNVNGVRLWCVDRDSGAIIHIGGEYTFGDCHAVGAVIERLSTAGILPADGDYGNGLLAQCVVVTDGAKWLVDYVNAKLKGAIAILDAYHAMEYLAAHSAVLHAAGSKAAKALYNRLVTALFGPKPKRPHRSPTRKGHKKRRGSRKPVQRLIPGDTDGDRFGIERLLKVLEEITPSRRHADEHAAFIAKIRKNQWRMDYPSLRANGIQIGSGPMESLHRNASQIRLKRPGAKWCQHTAEAVLNLRMLTLSERWTEFWEHASQPVALGGEFVIPVAA